jgi:hypothetical protein
LFFTFANHYLQSSYFCNKGEILILENVHGLVNMLANLEKEQSAPDVTTFYHLAQVSSGERSKLIMYVYTMQSKKCQCLECKSLVTHQLSYTQFFIRNLIIQKLQEKLHNPSTCFDCMLQWLTLI